MNKDLYKELAVKISILRNERICSSRANLQGFKVKDEDEVESVYHVLMPSSKGQTPEIYVGETEYDLIDVANIEIIPNFAGFYARARPAAAQYNV